MGAVFCVFTGSSYSMSHVWSFDCRVLCSARFAWFFSLSWFSSDGMSPDVFFTIMRGISYFYPVFFVTYPNLSLVQVHLARNIVVIVFLSHCVFSLNIGKSTNILPIWGLFSLLHNVFVILQISKKFKENCK